MRLKTVVVGVLLVGAFVTAGCGKNDDKASTAASSSATASVSASPSVAASHPNSIATTDIDDPKLTIDDLNKAFGVKFEQTDELPIKTMGRLTAYKTDGFSIGVIQTWGPQGWLTWDGVKTKAYPAAPQISANALLKPGYIVIVYKETGSLMGTYVSVTLDKGTLPANNVDVLTSLGKTALSRM